MQKKTKSPAIRCIKSKRGRIQELTVLLFLKAGTISSRFWRIEEKAPVSLRDRLKPFS
jgi:hypothetical protein